MNNNHNRNRLQRSQYFDTPPPSARYDYDSDNQRDFSNLLLNYPWNEHRWFGLKDNENNNESDSEFNNEMDIDDTRCERINTNIKISNTITDNPPEIYPYQAAFAAHYGYLPKGYFIPKRKSKRKKNRRKIKKLSTKQRLVNRKRKRDRNIAIYEENKRRKRMKNNKKRKQKQRQNNTNKVEVSHICGKNNCITVSHLELATRKKNNERATCHDKIDEMEYKLRKQNMMFYIELESDEEGQCNHEPHCFRNYQVTDWVRYHPNKKKKE